MALESVDLLTLLKRARKANNPDATPEPSAPPSSEVPLSSVQPATPPAPLPSKSEKVREEEELADLRAELLGDEVLIQRILGLLYRCKKQNPNGGYISILDMEKELGLPREAATFVMTYMKTTKIIEMDDKSRMAITVPGINYLRGVLGLQAAAASSLETDAQ